MRVLGIVWRAPVSPWATPVLDPDRRLGYTRENRECSLDPRAGVSHREIHRQGPEPWARFVPDPEKGGVIVAVFEKEKLDELS